MWKRITGSKGGLVALTVGTLCTIAFLPVFYHVNFVPRHDPSTPLPRSAGMRGAYVNTGSRDIGPEGSVSPKEA